MKRTLFLFTVATFVLAVIGVLLWQSRVKGAGDSDATQIPNSNAPIPSYLKEDPKVYITRPLLLELGSKQTLSPIQKQQVADFKNEILARVRSGMPLSQSEKIIIAGSIIGTAVSTGGMIVVDQRMLQFTPDELGIISKALQK